MSGCYPDSDSELAADSDQDSAAMGSAVHPAVDSAAMGSAMDSAVHPAVGSAAADSVEYCCFHRCLYR